MKIVKIDNLNRDDVADVLIAENVNPLYAELIVELLNRQARQLDHYVIRPDDYRLSRGMEDLV